MMTTKVLGKGSISATIIQDSIHKEKRITTFELEYPRFIHAEFMTHRMFSRNAASSRAIPVEKMHQHIMDNPAMPIYYGMNQSGMQAKQELPDTGINAVKKIWNITKNNALDSARALLDCGLHKQISNRVTEPFQMMKTVLTATEFDNWFWLRDHEDAQPEIRELANVMKLALERSTPMPINVGEWHVPYVDRMLYNLGEPMVYMDGYGNKLTIEEARMVSASCCAQVSYRKSDDSLEKAIAVFKRLIESEPVHASPVEHQATPMKYQGAIFDTNYRNWEEGVTHLRKDGRYCSGNFVGWIQFRQLIPNQSK